MVPTKVVTSVVVLAANKGKMLVNPSSKQSKSSPQQKKLVLADSKDFVEESKETPINRSLRLFDKVHKVMPMLLELQKQLSPNFVELRREDAALKLEVVKKYKRWDLEACDLKHRIMGGAKGSNCGYLCWGL